jgi:HD-GYP domain-containing protein (c-di-GMP phosphodiesterase class II)
MALTPRWWALWGLALGLPFAGLIAVVLIPAWDSELRISAFHFWSVSAIALASAVACVLILSMTESLRETRLVFLDLAFLCITGIFAVHGLATPGHIHADFHSELAISSWLSIFMGASFIALSVTPLPQSWEEGLRRNSGLILGAVALSVGVFIGFSMATPAWLDWVPYDNQALQYGATAVTLGILGVGAWRYYEAFRFARLPSQWAMVVALVLLMQCQVSITWGEPWYYSWWFYHAAYGVAFAVLLGGWAIEARRAGSVRVIAEALSMRDAMAQLNQGHTQPIADLVDAIEWKDLYTLGHVRRVASYAVMTGKALGLSAGELRSLALAAQMHDVGKIGVPDKILTKPGPLTPEEREVIREHADRGFEIALGVPALQGALNGIRYHHERWDGTGYPEGLRGAAIPLQARIVAVADAFDAMTSGRAYQPAVSNEAALAELARCAESHFDPECVRAFTAVVMDLRDVEGLAAAPTKLSHGGLAA